MPSDCNDARTAVSFVGSTARPQLRNVARGLSVGGVAVGTGFVAPVFAETSGNLIPDSVSLQVENTVSMNFSQRLAFERKRLGYKSSEFATACGVAAQSQSIYENDKRMPDAAYLMKACALGADPAFLLVGTPSHPSTLKVREEDQAPLVEFAGLSPKMRAAMINLIKLAKEEG